MSYTARGVVALFAVLLLGDFCSTVFESIFGPFMPLYLKELKASNTLIAILTTGLAGLMNVFFLPNISIWTDRTRTRWGRRIPFLFCFSPCAVVALLLIALAPGLAGALHPWISPHAVSLGTLTLGLLAVFVVVWHFFNLIVVNVYNFLLRDVVPIELMPRFLACFRVVGTAGHAFFQWSLFGYMLAYPKVLFAGVGLLFLVSFLIICVGVREGQYPPPLLRESERGVLKTFLVYFRESFSLPIYRNFFIAYGLSIWGIVPCASFLILFAQRSLHLSIDHIGKITAIATLASALLYVPTGYLCEKLNPFRVALAGLALGFLLRILGFFVVQSEFSWLVYSILIMLPTVAWNIGSFSVTMVLFPKEKFGQFSSGLNSIGYGSLIFASSAIGWLIDYTNNYRVIFLVSFACHLAAFIPMILVYQSWKARGGPDRYTPPLPQVA